MMGIPPSDARELDLWEFSAMRATWNARHRPEGDEGGDVEAPDAEFVRARQEELAALGIANAKAPSTVGE